MRLFRQQPSSSYVYRLTGKDDVIRLEGIPQSSIGAPNPTLIAGEHSITLIYYVEDTPENWDGTSTRIITTGSSNEPIAIISFQLSYAHYFGPPNDEAFQGHPLEKHGLSPYGSYEIQNSSWIHSLERLNSVHAHHKKQDFKTSKRHFVLAFHDSVFECIAKSYTIETTQGSIRDTAQSVLSTLE